MIEQNVKIHDKFSVEIKLGYATKRSKKINDYSVDSWFFIPNSLDINRYTYGKEQFYNDLKTNIRFSTPIYLLRDIAQGDNTPFQYLEKAFNNAASEPIRKNKQKYEYHIKMFQSILKSSLRNEIQHIKTNIVEYDIHFLIQSYIKNASIITKRFRGLRRIINVPTITDELMNYYFLADEFMSNILEQHTYYLLGYLKQVFPNDYRENKGDLLNLIHKEIQYREQQKYPTVEKKSNDNNGSLVYRRGVLKKYIESLLFLSTRKKKDGVFIEQISYSIAAGLSMIFATSIAFSFQQKFGNFTMPFFIALVISYMLKDRIKELMRYYLGGKLNKRLFDHKNAIAINKDTKIGWCKESFDYVTEEHTPKKVLEARGRSAIMEVENRGANESIVRYRKLLQINRDKLNTVYEHYRIVGITDVIRFNISSFIKNMDNPKIRVFYLDGDDYDSQKADKLYYINLVMKLKYEESAIYKRYRIVFNRSGIKKVEQL
ncbi:MAG: hypothetical protein B7C24_02130 [Bacteroidetes bacterium 4572_77]|nr:MAG: hypothetical protein B7C24_02130 [Bacteroidetes bacterium 4572_77]